MKTSCWGWQIYTTLFESNIIYQYYIYKVQTQLYRRQGVIQFSLLLISNKVSVVFQLGTLAPSSWLHIPICILQIHLTTAADDIMHRETSLHYVDYGCGFLLHSGQETPPPVCWDAFSTTLLALDSQWKNEGKRIIPYEKVRGHAIIPRERFWWWQTQGVVFLQASS